MKQPLYSWRHLSSTITISPSARKNRKRDILALIGRRIKEATKSIAAVMTGELWRDVRPHLGKRGPKTFTGTPQEVARLFDEWQRTP